MMTFCVIFRFYIMLIAIQSLLCAQCPTQHYRCACRLQTKVGIKEQTLSCAGLYALPQLNDSSTVSAQWHLIIQESNDIGTISPTTFSGIKRHHVRIWQCSRLSTVEDYAFKDARIDQLKISGFRSSSIDRIETEAFSGLQPLSVNQAPCDWADNEDDGLRSELACTTSISLTNIRNMHITDRSFVTLIQLQDLHLNVEQLKIDEGSLSNLYNLEQLRIINAKEFKPTKITFKGLAKLRVLYLKGLGLQTLSDDIFHETPHLQVVILSRNALTSFPMALTPLPQLHYLNLNKNQIKESEWQTMNSNENLWPEMLNFVAKDNELNSIPLWLNNLKHVEEVSLSGNSILCDCNLLWLRNWPPFHRKGIFGGLAATCDTENWKTCSKVCPFSCELRDCVDGLQVDHCATQPSNKAQKQNDQQTKGEQTDETSDKKLINKSSKIYCTTANVVIHVLCLYLI